MLYYFIIFVLGTIIGSFLNVVIFRFHSKEKIGMSRSHCQSCNHILEAADLIPVLSFFVQKGKCRYCGNKISWQYPLVELFTGIVFVLSAYSLVGTLGASMIFYSPALLIQWLRNIIFGCFLIVIFVYDFKWYLILDRVTVPAMAIALFFNWYLHLGLKNLFLAAFIGLFFFLAQYLVSKGKWIGGGDLRMGFLMGLMVGWPNIIVALFFSYVIGAIFSVFLIIIKRKKMKSQIPFGTFLALGTFIALYWGESIITWYRSLLI
ncbi:MAG: prepilin peptidase [Patescibacteria group bacterium]